MLERMKVMNFQTHREFRLIFDPLCTVIIGPNDRGKTALLRALIWLATNQPSGDEFISWSESSVKVKLWLDGGHSIVRGKGKGANVYLLDDQEPFRALGVGTIPEAVAKLLNVGPVNFQDQHSGPFWFMESAGEVSKRLNQIIDLSVIDEVLGRAAKEVRQARSVVEVSEHRIAAAKQRKEELSWVKKFSSDLAQLERIESELAQTRKTAASLSDLLQAASQLTLAGDRAGLTLNYAKKPLELGQQLANLEHRQHKLSHIIAELEQTEERLCQANEHTAQSVAELSDALQREGRCPLCQVPFTNSSLLVQ